MSSTYIYSSNFSWNVVIYKQLTKHWVKQNQHFNLDVLDISIDIKSDKGKLISFSLI